MTGRHVELTRIDGRVAVITGGARGIGAETARVFREAGATVVTWDVGDGADQRVDVTDARAVEAAVAATVAKLGGIDILVNNAGILRDGLLVKMKDGEVVGRMEEAQFDAVISVNLKGVFLCGQAVAPVMIKKGWGRILNASSVVGLYGNFGQSNYVATKAGVIGLTKVWARELGPKRHHRERGRARLHRDRDGEADARAHPEEHGRAHAGPSHGRATRRRERVPLPRV